MALYPLGCRTYCLDFQVMCSRLRVKKVALTLLMKYGNHINRVKSWIFRIRVLVFDTILTFYSQNH